MTDNAADILAKIFENSEGNVCNEKHQSEEKNQDRALKQETSWFDNWCDPYGASTDLVVIPTGNSVPVGTPLGEHAEIAKINLYAPKNIFEPNYSDEGENGGRFSHSPRERAEMLYEAITTVKKDKSGNVINDENGNPIYKYHNIYITGGTNTEDVIRELEKIQKERGALPARRGDLRIFGFSDATQLHHYLGQRAIATSYYNSSGLISSIYDLKAEKILKLKPTGFTLSSIGNAAEKCEIYENKEGILLPGSILLTEDRPTHQIALSKDKVNFVIEEFFKPDPELFAKAWLAEYKAKFEGKNIVLLLSQDTPEKVRNKLPALMDELGITDLPVFYGMPVGHGECAKGRCKIDESGNAVKERIGKLIPLFQTVKLTPEGNLTFNYATNEEEQNAENEELIAINRLNKEHPRQPYVPKSSSQDVETTQAVVEYSLGEAGMFFYNLSTLEKGATEYTISFGEDHPFTIQYMEMTLKKLYEKGIINKDKLTSVKFKANGVDKEFLGKLEKQGMHRRLEYLRDEYFPNLTNITCNGMECLPFKEEQNSCLAVMSCKRRTR